MYAYDNGVEAWSTGKRIGAVSIISRTWICALVSLQGFYMRCEAPSRLTRAMTIGAIYLKLVTMADCLGATYLRQSVSREVLA